MVRATSLGPTLFPIVFAGLVGRLMRTISVWRAQRGVKLGVWELLQQHRTFTNSKIVLGTAAW